MNPNKTHVGLLVKKEKIKQQQKTEGYNRDVGALVYHLFHVKLVMTKTVQFLLENISINII